jgi:hypothetical protein
MIASDTITALKALMVVPRSCRDRKIAVCRDSLNCQAKHMLQRNPQEHATALLPRKD